MTSTDITGSVLEPGADRADRADREVPNHRDAVVELLRSRGLRATSSRVAVFAAVDSLAGHPDVAAVTARVRAGAGSISTQAVYDCLASLTAAGLLRRIEPAGSPARYETRVGDNHHHIVCRVCGATQDVDCVHGATPCLQPEAVGGFAVDEAEVTFWGLCPDCQRAAVPDVPGGDRAAAPTTVN
jgi:Fur family ferric uptake transcriptional regulator